MRKIYSSKNKLIYRWEPGFKFRAKIKRNKQQIGEVSRCNPSFCQ